MKTLHRTNGEQISVGDEVVSFRGTIANVTGWQEPAHEGKAGYVHIEYADGQGLDRFYVGVFNLHWEGE